MRPAGKTWSRIKIRAAGVLLFSALTAIIIPVYLDSRREISLPVSATTDSGTPVLVIDPGHGGMDGGAVAADGTTEDEINLQIALRVQELSKLLGFPSVMTREIKELDYPDPEAPVRAKKAWDQKRRAALIQGTDHAVLLSIHQNQFPDKRPRGTQVLYAKTEGSMEYADLTHGNLITCVNPDNRRVAVPISNSIYLMKQIDCPGILVECGFLSNPAEAEKLKNGSYQTCLAVVLAASYLQFLNIEGDYYQ